MSRDYRYDLGSALYEDFERTFMDQCFGEKWYANGAFHLLFGQLPNIREMRIRWTEKGYYDPRVHLCLLSPSATGKGVGASIVDRYCGRLGLTYQVADKMTDSALVGTVDPQTKEVVKGWLDPSHGINILAMTEASMVLTERPSRHAQDVMNLLQKAMNERGSSDAAITKKIGFGEVIEVRPECSIFMTTYPPKHLSDIILDRGLLQRTFLVVNTESLDRRREVTEKRIEALDDLAHRVSDDTEERESYIAERLGYIDGQYRNKSTMRVGAGAVNHLERIKHSMNDQLEGVHPFIREEMGKFATRMDTLRMKIAMHRACLDLRDEINAADIGFADLRTSWLFESILAWLETTVQVPVNFQSQHRRKEQQVRKVIKAWLERDKYANSPGLVLREDVVQGLRTSKRLSRAGAENHIDYLVDHGILEEHKGGGQSAVRFR